MGRPKGSKNKPKVDENVKVPKKIVATKKNIENESVVDDEEEDDYPINTYSIEANRLLKEKLLDPFKVITTEKFECEFVGFTQWHGMTKDEPPETREGRYSGCYFPVEGCNVNFWPVLGYIKVDFERLRSQGFSDKVIFAGCINHLAEIGPPKKRKYGNLLPYMFSMGEDKLIVTFFTDVRRNPHFWSEGI